MKSSVVNVIKNTFVGKKIVNQHGVSKDYWGAVITDMYPNTDPYTGNPLIVITTDKYVSYECNFFTIHTDFELEVE